MTYHAKVIAGGKIVIPADLRRELGIKEGDSLVIEREGGGLTIKTYAETVREVQADFRAMRCDDDSSVVDSYLAEKREAARAEAEREARRRG